jgi:ferrochelatase
MRNWHPYISAALRQMVADEVCYAVVVCLAPQNSRTSVGLYRAALRSCADPRLRFDFVESWHDHPQLIQAFAEKLSMGRDRAQRELGTEVPVIFTAHSVPERTILDGDPYESQARETAQLVAAAAHLERADCRFAFQSQGLSAGAWLGPTVESTILDLKRSGYAGVFIQPIGFLSDHVEVLYDIDIVFQQFAEQQGMRLFRAESLNHSPLLIAALADIANSRLGTPAESARQP